MAHRAMNDAQSISEPVRSLHDEYDDLRFVSQESPCPYLSGRMARNELYLAEGLDPRSYSALLAQGFRRSGNIVYRPRCRGCRECKQMRVPVASFVPTRSMRRIYRHNADIRVHVGEPRPTDEKYEVYVRYLRAQHDGTMSDAPDSFMTFLYESPLDTLEFVYLLGNRVVGVSIVDPCADGLSSVYMFFDPDEAERSLGTFSILWEIEDCRRRQLPYYYLGYYVSGCRSMAYKARFRPNQVLVDGGRWITFQV